MSNEVSTQTADVSSAVETAKDIYLDLNKRVLLTYYNLGELVAGLDNKYGSNAVKAFETELSNKVGKDNALSSSSLYRCKQFFEKHSKDDVEKMSKTGISWAQVTKTLRLPVESVSRAVDSVSSGQVPPHKMSEQAAVITAGDDSPLDNQARQNNDEVIEDESGSIPVTPDKAVSNKSIKSRISKLYGPSITLVDLMADIWLIADDFTKLKEKEQEECKEELNKLSRCFDELAEMMNEASQKIKTM